MKEIVEVFQKKDLMHSYKEKLFWREELLYLIERKKSSDILLKEMVKSLDLSFSKNDSEIWEDTLINKFNLFLKYFKKPKKVLQKNLVILVNLSGEYLNDRHRFSQLKDNFFFSYELIAWADELYYLMGKLEKKDNFIYDTLELLRKARIILNKSDKLELEKHLSMFKIVKHRYINIKE